MFTWAIISKMKLFSCLKQIEKNQRICQRFLSKRQGRVSLQIRFEWVVNVRVSSFLLLPCGVWLVLLNGYSCCCPIAGTGIPRFTVLCFIKLHRWCVFNKLKARPCTSKRIMTCFIEILALLQWSGMKPATSLRRACMPMQSSYRWSLRSSFKTCLASLRKGQ